MLRTALLLGPLLLATSATAAITGSGLKLTETRKVTDFSEIEVSDGVKLEVKKGAPSLVIEGDDNIVPLYATEVVAGRLRIHRKTNEAIRTRRPLTVRVTMRALERLDASGGVDATIDGVWARAFAATLSGGVELDAKGLDVDTFELDASGGVNVRADGTAKRARLHASGGVGLKAKALQIGAAELDGSGGCELELTARESITGELSGGVGVTVYGHPPKSRVRTSGGAGVEYLD